MFKKIFSLILICFHLNVFTAQQQAQVVENAPAERAQAVDNEEKQRSKKDELISLCDECFHDFFILDFTNLSLDKIEVSFWLKVPCCQNRHWNGGYKYISTNKKIVFSGGRLKDKIYLSINFGNAVRIRHGNYLRTFTRLENSPFDMNLDIEPGYKYTFTKIGQKDHELIYCKSPISLDSFKRDEELRRDMQHD